MGTDPLRELDEPSAALRILLELSRNPQGINVTALYDSMSSRGAGRTTVESSRRALVKAGLASEYSQVDGRGRRFVILETTSLGSEVAQKIEDIEKIMGKA